MPTLDPRLAGLTNTGYPSSRSTRARQPGAVACPFRPDQRDVGRDRQAVGGEQLLHHHLVHADGRPEHAGADVGHVGQLQQALHRAVLAVRAVQHRKDDVHDRRSMAEVGSTALEGDACGSAAARRRRKSRLAAGAPRIHRPSFSMRIGHRLVASAIQMLEDGRRRRDRHFVFARAAAIDDADANFLHRWRYSEGALPATPEGAALRPSPVSPQLPSLRCRARSESNSNRDRCRFGFSLRATDGAARLGRIETPHGGFDTPAFMPVGTQGTRQDAAAPRPRVDRERRDHPRQHVSPDAAPRRRADRAGSAASTGLSAGRVRC